VWARIKSILTYSKGKGSHLDVMDGVCSGILGWQGVSGFIWVEDRGCAVPLLSFGCFDAGPLELSEL
jgi:hypothetical protein